MHTAAQVAGYFLSLTDEDAGDTISNLKLQKLLYYAQGFSLALENRPLFDEPLVAWTHGPVVVEVYHAYKGHGSGAIPLPRGLDLRSFDKTTRELLNEVYHVYGQYAAWKLRGMTHEEPPWRNAYREAPGTVIRHPALKRFFKTLIH